mgnify:CR=1 FL=1
MLTIRGGRQRFCDGVSRRDFLAIGGLLALGVRADLAGAKVPDRARTQVDGRSLVPLLADPRAPWADRTLVSHVGRWTPGTNPDIEVHDVLTRAGSENVAALYGWLEQQDAEGRPWQLALLQQFLRTATDGWTLALGSVRDLFAETVTHTLAPDAGDQVHARDAGGVLARVGKHDREVERVAPLAVGDRLNAHLRVGLHLVEIVGAADQVGLAEEGARGHVLQIGGAGGPGKDRHAEQCGEGKKEVFHGESCGQDCVGNRRA